MLLSLLLFVVSARCSRGPERTSGLFIHKRACWTTDHDIIMKRVDSIRGPMRATSFSPDLPIATISRFLVLARNGEFYDAIHSKGTTGTGSLKPINKRNICLDDVVPSCLRSTTTATLTFACLSSNRRTKTPSCSLYYNNKTHDDDC
jgi:hypothetical protein